MNQKSIAYVRVSTDKQDYQRQKRELQEYAEKNELIITKFFEDKQSGSEYIDRSGFQDALQYLRDNNGIKIILFDAIDRMGRDNAEQAATYKQLSNMEVSIWTKGRGEFGKNKDDEFLFNILSAVAQFERQTIIDRTSSGRRQVVRDGHTQLSNKLYGYNINKTIKKDRLVIKRQSLSINEEEAVIVRQMFDMASRGFTAYDIQKWLVKERVCAPKGGDVWGISTILRKLHDSSYYGEWKWGKYVKNGQSKYSLTKKPEEDWITVKIPPIIDRKIFDKVQKQLEQKRTSLNPKNTKNQYLLQGITFCDCGGLLQCSYNKANGIRNYRCPQRNTKGVKEKTCPIKSLNSNYIESIILSELKEKMGDISFLQEERIGKLKNQNKPNELLKKKLKRLENTFLENNRKIKILYSKAAEYEGVKAKINEELADELLIEQEAVENDIVELKKSIEVDIGKEIDFESLREVSSALRRMSLDEIISFKKGDSKIKKQFVIDYIQSISINYKEADTIKIKNKINHLKECGLYKKGNEPLLRIYQCVNDRNGNPRKNGIIVVDIEVLFVNNYSESFSVLYAHNDPSIVSSFYKKGGVVSVINNI